MELVKVRKIHFLKKNKLFFRYRSVPLKSCIFAAIKIQYKKRVKRSTNVKYLFYKNNAEKIETFQMQIMLKGGNRHARVSCTCPKLSIRTQKKRHVFSIWTTFNNPRGVLIGNFKQIYSIGSFVFFNVSFLRFKI